MFTDYFHSTKPSLTLFHVCCVEDRSLIGTRIGIALVSPLLRAIGLISYCLTLHKTIKVTLDGAQSLR